MNLLRKYPVGLVGFGLLLSSCYDGQVATADNKHPLETDTRCSSDFHESMSNYEIPWKAEAAALPKQWLVVGVAEPMIVRQNSGEFSEEVTAMLASGLKVWGNFWGSNLFGEVLPQLYELEGSAVVLRTFDTEPPILQTLDGQLIEADSAEAKEPIALLIRQETWRNSCGDEFSFGFDPDVARAAALNPEARGVQLVSDPLVKREILFEHQASFAEFQASVRECQSSVSLSCASGTSQPITSTRMQPYLNSLAEMKNHRPTASDLESLSRMMQGVLKGAPTP